MEKINEINESIDQFQGTGNLATKIIVGYQVWKELYEKENPVRAAHLCSSTDTIPVRVPKENYRGIKFELSTDADDNYFKVM